MKKFFVTLIAIFAISGMAYAAVNINSATKEQLETLNGIGPVKAQAIIDYRKKNGSFKSLEDIKKVNGIGDKTFDALKKDLALSGETQVASPKPDPKKDDTKKDDIKADAKKADIKADAKKADIKADAKKADIKADAKKADIKADAKKADIKADAKKADIKADAKKADIKADAKKDAAKAKKDEAKAKKEEAKAKKDEEKKDEAKK